MLSPNINIDGYVSGYTGAYVKTMFPDRALAKIDIRLVPDQTMDEVLAKLRKHFDRHGFPEVEIKIQGCYNPSKTSLRGTLLGRCSVHPGLGASVALGPACHYHVR